MSTSRETSRLNAFLEAHAKDKGRFVPARIQAALALLERLRDDQSLDLLAHREPGSTGIRSHETYGDKALARLKLTPLNKNHGRRSSNLPGWGQELLDMIGSFGFATASGSLKETILTRAQETFAIPLRQILEQDPIEVQLRGRTAEAILKDIMLAADEKGKSGDVAQYLVGAKLELRLKQKIPVYPANKSDRTSYFDPAPRQGDFEIQNAVIEVAVGPPDPKHLQQIEEILESSDSEVWLLTRSDRVSFWDSEIKAGKRIDTKRVVVTSVEAFVGQNVSEIAGFSAKQKGASLKALFEIYNTRWVAKVGTPGIRIFVK